MAQDSAGGLVAVSDGELPDEEDGELSELSEIRYFFVADLSITDLLNSTLVGIQRYILEYFSLFTIIPSFFPPKDLKFYLMINFNFAPFFIN